MQGFAEILPISRLHSPTFSKFSSPSPSLPPAQSRRFTPGTPHPDPRPATMADDHFDARGTRPSSISLNESLSGTKSFVELLSVVAEARDAHKSALNTGSHADVRITANSADVRIGDAYKTRKERTRTEDLARIARDKESVTAA